MKAGQKVTFTVDAFQGETFNGSVQEVRLNPTTTSNVVTYTVVIAAENPDQKLLPGMTATCTIVTREVVDAISVPVKALKFSPGVGPQMAKPGALPSQFKGDRVWLNVDGKLAPRPVKTGINDGVNVEILEGLSLGDSVVVGQESAGVSAFKKSEASSPFMPTPPGKKKRK